MRDYWVWTRTLEVAAGAKETAPNRANFLTWRTSLTHRAYRTSRTWEIGPRYCGEDCCSRKRSLTAGAPGHFIRRDTLDDGDNEDFHSGHHPSDIPETRPTNPINRFAEMGGQCEAPNCAQWPAHYRPPQGPKASRLSHRSPGHPRWPRGGLLGRRVRLSKTGFAYCQTWANPPQLENANGNGKSNFPPRHDCPSLPLSSPVLALRHDKHVRHVWIRFGRRWIQLDEPPRCWAGRRIRARLWC